MARRRIEGTKHVRRRTGIGARIAIGVAAVALLSAGGYFLIAKSGISLNLKKNKGSEIAVENSYNMEESLAGYIPDDGSITSGTLKGISSNTYNVTAKSSTLTSTGAKDTTTGGSIVMSERTVDNGYGETVKIITLDAMANSGYSFVGWASDDNTDIINNSNKINVIADSTYYVGESAIRIYGDKTFYAVFKKNNATSLEPFKGTANGDTYGYTLYTYPALGSIYIDAGWKDDGTDHSYTNLQYGGSNWWWTNNNGNIQIDHVNFQLRYPYTQAMTMWPVDQMNHSDDDHHDSYAHNKSVKASFALYIYDGSTYYGRSVISRYCQLGDSYNSTNDAVFDIKLTDSDVLGDAAKDPHSFNIYVVPLMQQGTNYQVYVSSDDSKRGRAAGTASSPVPFTTSIKAFPFEGYDFDFWRFHTIDSYNYTYIYDESTYNANIQTQEVSFYTACFKPATYKVYGSNLPSDGGTVKVKGNVMTTAKDITTVAEKEDDPGKLDYCYTYNTDSDSSDYEKVTAKPKVHVTITPNPGYEIESWSYVLSDIGTVNGDSAEFDIVDFEEDINLTVKYTNGKARIEVESSPVTGGTATIKKGTDGQEKYDYEEFLPGQETAILKATPIDDAHVFLYWKDTNGQKYEDATLTLNKVASSEKFTAYFAPKTINIKTAVYPLKDGDTDITAGTVTVTGDTVAYDETNKWYTATPNTSVTIKAQDGDGYHFQKFIDSSSNEYTTNPLIRTDIISNTTFTAVFVPDTFDISAQASPVTGGKVTVNEREGSNTVTYGQDVTLVATPSLIDPDDPSSGSNYVFRYFEDQNGNQYRDANIDSGTGAATFKIKAVNGAETYKAVFAPKKVNIGVEVDPVTKDDGKYVAGNYEVTYTPIEGTDVALNPHTTESSIGNIKGQTDVKIRAIPLNGYHFVRFVDKRGQNYTDNPLILHDVVEDDNITIVFDDDELTVNAVSSPDEGGEVTIDGKAGTQKVKYDQEVKLIAKPRAGYMFRYFQDENGNTYKGDPLLDGSGSHRYTFKAVNQTTTYKAVFVRSTVELDMKYDPESIQDPSSSTTTLGDIKGGVVVTYKKWKVGSTSETEEAVIANPGRNEITDIAGLTDITIKAVEKSGYRFSRFVDGKGNIYTDNPMVLTSVTDNQTVTAIFVPEVFEISAKASPVTGGTVSVRPSGGAWREGSNTVSYGATVELEAKPSDDFIFRYFEDEHGNRYKGTSGMGGVTNFTFKAVNGPEKYMAVFTPKEVNLTVDEDPVKMEGGAYVAGKYEVTYTNTDGTTPAPIYTKKEVITGIKGQTDIKIRAIPLNGYHFVRFVDSKGNNYTDNPLILHDVVADEAITIVYDDDELTVNAVSSPDEGGTVTINGKAGTNKVKYDELVTLAAKPKAGTEYRFWYFEDEDGNHYSGTKVEDGEYAGCFVHTFNAVNPTTTYKAVFVRNTLSLEMIYDPTNIYDPDHPENPANGGVVVTYKNLAGEQVITNPGRNQINDIVGLSDVKIKAIESAGYKFSKFVDRTGKVYTDNPLVLPAVTEDLSIIAIFVEDHWMINTQASPENGGYVKIDNVTKNIIGKTSLDVDYNDEIKLMAFPNNGESGGEAYRFLYWKDSHGTEYLANPLTFKAINGSETYTAHFAKANVNIEVEVMPKGTGSVRFNSEPPTTYKATYNTQGASNATLSASPESEYEFLYWKDQDGNTYTDNPLVLVDIERDLRFAAVFDSQIVGIKAVSSPASGGHIKKVLNSDGSITLNAVANKGYKFANWKKGEKLLTMGTKYTVASSDIKNGDVYTAYFKIDPNYDAKSDITKEKFYREWRKVITPNYTVTRDSMKLLAMQTVAGLTQYNDATPGLKSYGAVASAEAYFDERVAKDIARLDGVFGDAELMTVEGETLIPDMMPDIDIYQKAAENFTDKKFGKRYDTEILTVKRVLEPEGFNNKKRTYLWRYTGAEYKDNVYLLYKVDDKKPKYVTPIVDEDGVLKFTIDKLDDNDVVAVVRTKIK